MLTINTRTDKLAAARVDFLSRGMLQGTCLGEALELWNRNLGSDGSDDDDNGNNDGDGGYGGPDGNGEGGSDLDIDHDNNEDDGSPGPVDGPPIFSEVVLARTKGIKLLLMYIKDAG